MRTQIQSVGDGGQRIVDFVGDDAGHAAHGGEFFGFAQGFFGLQLRGDVAADLEDGVAFVVHGFAAGDYDLGAGAGLLDQVALPELLPCSRFSISSRGAGKTVCRTCACPGRDLVAGPAVERLRRPSFQNRMRPSRSRTMMASVARSSRSARMRMLFAVAEFFSALGHAPLPARC